MSLAPEDTPADDLPTLGDLRAARERLSAEAVLTPLVSHPALDQVTGGRVLLKLESLQRVGAFKFRGAYNKIVQVDRARYPGGVVACSSGNHAQGVAEAARITGHRALIVMPSDAPRIKVARTRAFGAEIVLYDRVTQDREAIARAHCAQRQAALVLPYDDPDIIAGQGTTGLEIVEQAAALGLVPDAVLAPCSGGGLVTGIAIAVRAAHPRAEIVSVEPAGFDDFARSLAAGRRVGNAGLAGSICDALMAQTPGVRPFALARELLSGGLSVTDDEVRAAMRFAFAELKLVTEPGGAAALAAVLAGKLPVVGRTVVAVISGGNVDPDDFGRIVAAA